MKHLPPDDQEENTLFILTVKRRTAAVSLVGRAVNQGLPERKAPVKITSTMTKDESLFIFSPMLGMHKKRCADGYLINRRHLRTSGCKA
jgi:hypothetical protein